MNDIHTVEEWLGKDNKLGQDIWHKKYQKNEETFDAWLDRVSLGNPAYRRLIELKMLIPGGRILSNVGIDDDSCGMSNCYSRGFVEDDYSDIMQAAVDIGKTFKAQGGEGLSLSKLRPKGTPIGDKYESDGIVPFMKIYNEVTEGTSQGGARKGALLMSLDAWHKEAINFITIKSAEGLIEKANLSLEIDNDFMECIKAYYETGEVKTVTRHENYSGHEVEWEVTPIEVFQAFIHNNYEWGDPGCLFVDKFRNYNLMEFCDNYQIEACNPCGEQPLPKHGACNLAAINLSEFVVNPYTNDAGFDFDSFEAAVMLGIQYLDKIVDFNANRHALPQQKKMALEFRNCGLGVMGYATMLMKLGLQYGSDDAIRFSDDLFSYMFVTAVRSSSQEAKKLGTFPGYRDQIFNSNIILNHFGNGAISDLRSIGLRNCSLLSIAPTGSIATMLGESGGIEPEFAISYTRRTVGLTDNEDHYYTVYCKAASEYLAAHPECDGVLPDWFVSSADIDPIRRVKTQAVIQKHIDTAISSTVNLPEAASEDDMARIYIEAWKQGTKGLTIFRSGCKREAILTTGDTTPKKNEQKNDTCTDCLNRGMIIGVDDDLMSIKKTIINGCGKFYLHVDFDETSLEFLETYIDIGSGGGCERNLQFISRLMSLALRAGVPLEAIIDQAYSIRPCNAYLARTKSKGDTSPGTSCPSAIGKALEEMKKKAVYLYGDDTEEAPEVVSDPAAKKANNTKTNHNDSPSKCPECGAQLRFEGGCDVCPECGYSHCG